MGTVTRAIQVLILFSIVLGVFFLWQAYPLLPSEVFYALTFGWLLFVVDAILTFFRPRASYFLGLVLAAVALVETLSQPEHYAFVENGDVPATVTLVLGSVAEALIVGLVVYYIVSTRRNDPWSWPGSESGTAGDDDGAK